MDKPTQTCEQWVGDFTYLTYVESFFHTMKADLIHHKLFDNEIEAVAHIIEFTEFYNRERLHSGLNYLSPDNYEKLCA